MTAKRALVVDDSRSARLSLQRLLEKYQITVDFAESGEEALDYLKHHMVDAIFMDHTMPGMDGLETVVAIKSNPRTATIPVMMYTAKEGEVYVSQARALGAIGVLPKQVQPGVLFEMLRKLGLVRDDPNPDANPDADPRISVAGEMPDADPALSGAPRADALAPAAAPLAGANRSLERFDFDAIDAEYDQQALGASVQSLITRILNEQHLKLRSDILTTHRDFARQVAAEIFARERAAAGAVPPGAVVADESSASAPDGPVRAGRWSAAGLGLLVAMVFLGAFSWHLWTERDGLRGEVQRLAAVAAERESAMQSVNRDRLVDLDAERARTDARHLAWLRGMEWALNQGGLVGFDELPFDDRRAVELERLLRELVAIGFQGTVRVYSHLGEFCLAGDPAGTDYRLAPPAASVDACTAIGHPLDDAGFVEARQSAGFASFLLSSPLVNERGVEVEIVALDVAASVAAEPMPSSATTAGEWNAVAARNHRVQYSIIPAETAASERAPVPVASRDSRG